MFNAKEGNGPVITFFSRRRLAAICLAAGLVRAVDAGLVNDPIGDASGHPDAISISGRFSGGNLFLTAAFSNGTLNPTNLGFMFGFDLDRNPSTGVQPPASFPLGAEATVYFSSAENLNDARLSTQSLFQRLRVTFGSNSLSLVIPLSSLGGGDGVMGFGFIVGVPDGTNGFFGYDTVPDSASGGPLSALTTPVPELRIRHEVGAAIVSWDARATDYSLESTPALSPSAVWTRVTNAVNIIDGQAVVHDTDTAPSRFYRMRL